MTSRQKCVAAFVATAVLGASGLMLSAQAPQAVGTWAPAGALTESQSGEGVVLEDGRVVLIRQFRYPLRKYILEFPAGKLDSHLSPEETIARELEEEAGYRAQELTHECSFYTSPGISNELLHLFVARSLEPVQQRLEDGEHISVERYTLEQCLDKVVRGEIMDGKTLLGLFWYQFKFK